MARRPHNGGRGSCRVTAAGVSLQRLHAIAAAVPHPVYWVGARSGSTYELTQTDDGRTYIRYLPAGTRVGAVAGGFALLDVRSVTTVGPTSGSVRRVLVTVDARDRVSRAVMALRYRVRLVRRDRWYVAELNTAGSATR